MGAIASLAQPVLPVEPGGQATVEVTIRNTGTVVDQFTIEVLGDGGAWATADPPTVSLFPGAEGATKVTFRPPRDSTTRSGQVRFGVMVRSKEDPAGSRVEEGTLDVAPFLVTTGELVPRTSHGSRAGRHDLAVDNRGNTATEAELEGLDPDRLVRFQFDPPTLPLDPGVASFAKLSVRPAKTFWRGQAKSRPFQVAVKPRTPNAMPILLDGTYLQESILPWWFVRALIAAIALLIALILFWVFILQPAIKSSATDALIDFGLTPRPSRQVVSPGPGPTLGPLPTNVTPVSPPPGGGRTNVDGRLDTATNAVGVSGGTLFITDLVFSNPGGASGQLTLQRSASDGSGTPLMVLRLENFRDLDFHFVTPIAIRAGDILALIPACTAPVPPATAGECVPAVFYSGYLQAE